MAQWLGQFSGHTHLTKVKDQEQQLQHTVEVLGAKRSPAERNAYMETVLRFAEKLLLARLRALKGNLASLDPRDFNEREAVQSRISEVTAEGVTAVLSEFKVSTDDCQLKSETRK